MVQEKVAVAKVEAVEGEVVDKREAEKAPYDFEVKREKLTIHGIDTGKDAIYRADAKVCLGVVSRDYKMVTHQEAAKTAYEAMKGFGKFSTLRHHLTQGGARVYIEFKAEKQYNIGKIFDGKDDIVNPMFVLNNSYDGTKQCGFEFAVYRLVCKNGLRVPQKVFISLHKHTQDLNLTSTMAHLKQLTQDFETKTLPLWKTWNTRAVKVDSLVDSLVEKEYVTNRTVKRLREANQFEKNKTAWDVYNTFTAYYTHDYKDSFDSAHYYNQRVIDGMMNVLG